MFDHVTIRVADREASERFYSTVLGALGAGAPERGTSFTEWGDFSVAQADEEFPVSRGLHIGFGAGSRPQVDEFWRTGTTAGHRDDGAPGIREVYLPDYYGGFLLDPDGNSAEAVHYSGSQSPGAIDHVWIRVADLDASRRFYELIAPIAGFRKWRDGSDRVGFETERGSFSIVAGGEPSAHVHIAFPAADNAIVDRFHAELTAAGHRDNGGPGERPVYHPGYYGAFVLDPDGNNVELVCHNR